MSEAANPGGGDEVVPAGFSAEDLRLGRKATRNIRVLCVAALVASAANAGFVFLNVPWDTRMPYDGQFDRSGNGIPMQIAMLPCLLLLIRIWWDGRRPDAHRMRKGSRIGTYILEAGLSAYAFSGSGSWGKPSWRQVDTLAANEASTIVPSVVDPADKHQVAQNCLVALP